MQKAKETTNNSLHDANILSALAGIIMARCKNEKRNYQYFNIAGVVLNGASALALRFDAQYSKTNHPLAIVNFGLGMIHCAYFDTIISDPKNLSMDQALFGVYHIVQGSVNLINAFRFGSDLEFFKSFNNK